MDGLLAPAALAAAALAVPILIVYMLKTRRPRQVIPSTFLWRAATKNVSASRPWDRIRSNVLLFLQLLALAALVLALAQPYRSAPGVAGDQLVLVMDASGSMAATDQEPSRIEAARTEAGRLIESLEPGATVSVVAADSRPRVLVSSTTNRDEAMRAVEAVEPSESDADFAEAFLLAESLETPGHPATIALISDGGLSDEERELVPEGTVVRTVGSSPANVAISGLEVGEGPNGFRAFVQIQNHDAEDAREVELSLEIDDAPVVADTLEIKPGALVERSFDLGPQSGRLVAAIDAEDTLPHDNRAYAVLQRSAPRRILLVGPGNFFLEALLSQIPGSDVTVSKTPQDPSRFDLAIYDRSAPPRSIEAPALFIAPETLPVGVEGSGTVRHPQITFVAVNDPLLDQVDLSELAIARTADVRVAGARTLIGTGDAPLVATWTKGSYRRAFIGFALNESNLPLQVAFPIFADHLLSWLTGSEPPSARYAGDAIDVAPVPGATVIEAAIPGAKGERLLPGQALEETARAGFYELTFLNGDDPIGERTIALSFPPSESDLRPRDIEVTADPRRPGLTETSRRPIVAWVLAILLAFLMLEWWWGHGRPGAPALTSLFRRERAA
ncbi:MAG TPA: VWA domain-containing protein [Actinomycetota bacterium]|nr:VWA domain-containing protein [Actinomycetota bacterium]